METLIKKNWKDDYLINESLHALSQNTSATYSRLKIKHPTHEDFQLWKTKSEFWNNYNNNIRNLELDTEDKAEKEVTNVSTALKEAETIEKSLNKKTKLSI